MPKQLTMTNGEVEDATTHDEPNGDCEVDHTDLEDGEQCPNCGHTPPLPAPSEDTT